MKKINHIALLILGCAAAVGCAKQEQMPGQGAASLESVNLYIPQAYATKALGDDPTMDPLSGRGAAAIGHELTVAVSTEDNTALYAYNATQAKWLPKTTAIAYPTLGKYDIWLTLQPAGTPSAQDGTLKGLLDADVLKTKLAAHDPVKNLAGVAMGHANTLMDITVQGLPTEAMATSVVTLETADDLLTAYNIPGQTRFQAILPPDEVASTDVSLTYQGKTYWCTVEAPQTTFAAGTRYKFNMMLLAGKLVITPVAIDDWNEGGAGAGSGQALVSNFEITGYPAGTVLDVAFSNGATGQVTLDDDGKGSMPFTDFAQAGGAITSIQKGTDPAIRVGLPATTMIRFSVDGAGKVIPREDNGVALVSIIEELMVIKDNPAKSYKQENDIDLTGITWAPVGTPAKPFSGTYNGNGFKINELNIPGSNDKVAMFAYNRGTLNKIHIASGSVAGKDTVAVLCVFNVGGTISDCVNEVDLAGKSVAAGICAVNQDNGSITGCQNKGKVSVPAISLAYIGGVCARNDAGTIARCTNSGAVSTAGQFCAGIAAYNGISSTIERCMNNAVVDGGGTTSSSYIGGIAGQTVGLVKECGNTAAVKGRTFVGGVAGANSINGATAPEGTPTVVSCYNSAAIEGVNGTGSSDAVGNIGGVVGYNGVAGLMTACWNTGSVTNPTTTNAGGVCGYCRYTGATITACWTSGAVYAEASATTGAVAGRYYQGGEGISCYYDASKTLLTDVKGTAFSATAWPNSSTTGWSSYWGNYGSWNGGNPTYPKLDWQ